MAKKRGNFKVILNYFWLNGVVLILSWLYKSNIFDRKHVVVDLVKTWKHHGSSFLIIGIYLLFSCVESKLIVYLLRYFSILSKIDWFVGRNKSFSDTSYFFVWMSWKNLNFDRFGNLFVSRSRTEFTFSLVPRVFIYYFFTIPNQELAKIAKKSLTTVLQFTRYHTSIAAVKEGATECAQIKTQCCPINRKVV